MGASSSDEGEAGRADASTDCQDQSSASFGSRSTKELLVATVQVSEQLQYKVDTSGIVEFGELD